MKLSYKNWVINQRHATKHFHPRAFLAVLHGKFDVDNTLNLMEDKITLELSRDDALVLEGLFARFEQENSLALKHNAESIALSRIAGQIEKALVEPFQSNYMALLAAARSRVAEGYEGLAPGVSR